MSTVWLHSGGKGWLILASNPTPIIEPDGLENLDHVDFNCVKLISIPPRRSDGSPVDSDGITECILYAGMRDPIFEVPGFPCRVPWPTKPAHTLEKIEGIGWGMFAKRNIKAGELIYAERPLLLSKVAWDPSRKCDDPQQRMKVAKVEAEHKLGEALKRMTPDRREAFRKLQNCHSHEVDCPQLFGILRTNGSAANDALKECIPSLPNNEYGSFKVVGETCSRVNHSCRPNARDHFELQSFSLQLTAARDIRVGEEITIRYVNALESRAVRQAKLDAYYFICSCRACTNSTISDHRRQQLAAVEPIESVEAVVRWLNDRALPDDHLEKKALKLLGLLEEEGLESLEIYWFCKQTLGIVYAALGNERRALKYLKEVITQQEAHERYDGMSATEYQRHDSEQSALRSTLVYDVFDYLMAFLETRELLSVMSTCRTLYNIALRHLLRAPIQLGLDTSRQTSFCDFVLADAQRRCSLIRRFGFYAFVDQLRTSDGAQPSCPIDKLIRVLGHSQNLRALEIGVSDELVTYPGFSRALTSNHNLKSLSFWCYTDSKETISILRSLQCPLVSLRVYFTANLTPDIQALLAHLAPYLQTLHTGGVKFPKTVSTPFTKLHTLTLRSRVMNFDAHHLAQLFPNLQSLVFECDVNPVDKTAIDDSWKRITPHKDAGWSRLQHIRGSVENLHQLGLTCPVDYVELELNVAADIDRAAEILDNLRPVKLRLYPPMLHRSMTAILPAMQRQKISHLILLVMMDTNLVIESPDIVQGEIEFIFKCLKSMEWVETFGLTIVTSGWLDFEGQDGSFHNAFDRMMAGLRSMRPKDFAAVAAEHIPRLRNLDLSIEYNSQSLWKIERLPGGGYSLEQRMYTDRSVTSSTNCV
ncbi:hypothetical protein CERSUDRAFT_91039 [Gelatoporia subvermispora B]|uniref:SET domain-containing protein n=1 Tax=Ceriporiopsis subvermispora (strain B) TaxID=914234 RepID=M2QTE8_CERS8|nr:hypothetical protein CERSUDRAFT_91039 [Gelatoporia subvermispora B]